MAAVAMKKKKKRKMRGTCSGENEKMEKEINEDREDEKSN